MSDIIQRIRTHVNAGNLFGGFAAMLVALPSAIAYGLIIFAPLGREFASTGAVAGIIGSVVLGIIAPIFGGTSRLVSSPCAPAAAVLSVFVLETLSAGAVPKSAIPLYIALVSLGAGLVQILGSLARGGTFIKYIPYPVIAGYLSGVGILIFLGQIPKFIGLAPSVSLAAGLFSPALWRWESIVIGSVTIAVMLLTPRVIKAVPASIAALAAGIACYFAIAIADRSLLSLEGNPLVIGHINATIGDLGAAIAGNVTSALTLKASDIARIVVPVLTLGLLLSVDTLKTCVVLDVLTGTRHNSNRELFGQGIANMASALVGGAPGSGTMGGTMVNIMSGGKSRASSLIAGAGAMAVLLFFVGAIAWIPVASLAGVLLVVGFRMVDRKSLQLLRHRSTRFDFAVILAVIVSALSMDLIAAAGVGIGLAIALFLREQLRFPVVRRIMFGNNTFSKKNRLASEHAILEREGRATIVIELQGQLFFGTTDQLYSQLEPYLGTCRYFIFDMRRVLSLDFTAANMLTQIKKKILESNGRLIFTSVPLSVPTGQKVRKYLANLGFTPEEDRVLFLPELDNALEWVEDELLKEYAESRLTGTALHLSEFEFFAGAPKQALATLARNIDERTYANGDKIFSFGESGGEIFFIKKGEVRIELPIENHAMHHIATFGRGDFFGDISFLNREERSADAIAVGDVELYIMRREQFDGIAAQYPEIAGIFYFCLASEIARRLRMNLIELMAIEES